MIGPTEPARSTFPSTKQALVILVAGLVVLAFTGLILVLALAGGNSRATLEVYNYHLFVRMRNPGASAELWVPVPDFTEFFFQAEDGIRYLTVTGVQTCALPI